jgi:hypothetical protein
MNNNPFSPKALIMAQKQYLTAAENFRFNIQEFEMDQEKTFGKRRK